jgi:hypothetical protein
MSSDRVNTPDESMIVLYSLNWTMVKYTKRGNGETGKFERLWLRKAADDADEALAARTQVAGQLKAHTSLVMPCPFLLSLVQRLLLQRRGSCVPSAVPCQSSGSRDVLRSRRIS